MARPGLRRGGSLVLDSEGLSQAAAGGGLARAYLKDALDRGTGVVVSAVTLSEVLRGGARDAAVHRVLHRVTVVPVSGAVGRRAGELLGTAGLSGHRHAIDAVVAATALAMPAPALVVTSDPRDLGRLVEDLTRPKEDRVRIGRV